MMPYQLGPLPQRRSRCLSLWPRPPPPPRGPEGGRLSRLRPRWAPKGGGRFQIRAQVQSLCFARGSAEGQQYLRSVSRLSSERLVHYVSDGEPGHGALSERDDLIDALHHALQVSVGLQGELAADLRTKQDSGDTEAEDCIRV